MDRNFTIMICVFLICTTILIFKGCDQSHKEAMKCAEQGKTWLNSRCWEKSELK